jgi:putative ABC transport system permease protein
MKAIGLRDRKIKNLYMVKYVGLAIIGSIIGCLISFPFGRVLLKDVSENIMIGNSIGELLNVIGAVIVFGLIVGFAYICTGKLKKLTPTDAIREGESGERFGKKGGIRISKSHSKNARYLAINDILSSPRRYLNILISILICATFLLVISNTCSTLNSDICKDSFGAPADLYLKLPTSRWEKELAGIEEKYPEAKDTKEKLLYYFIDMSEKLEKEGIPCKIGIEASYSLKVEYEGKEYSYEITQGLNISSDQYAVLEGENPKNKNEIAITSLASENTGIKIGDTVTIRIGNDEDKYIVSGIYQSMANNNGDTMRFHEDVPISFEYMLGSSHPRIFFEDTPDDAEFERRRDVVKELFDAEEVMDAREFCVDTMGAYDMIKAVEMLLIVVTLVVVALITILMERTFVTDEKKQIAILKAIGFRDREVIKWHVFRFFILALISVLIAMAISVPVTNLTITPIFKIMGAVKVDYVYNFVSLFKYPLIIVGATSVIAMVTAGFTNKIKAVDTASIE